MHTKIQHFTTYINTKWLYTLTSRPPSGVLLYMHTFPDIGRRVDIGTVCMTPHPATSLSIIDSFMQRTLYKHE